ncbi:MAG TPA: YSC84-related protein [Dinghuibacter sp.]|uniref:lipid-binding SYLF domain-containing protein n=1 Tax=Dinghuibacter sp. TaxID=2024697 RepID=UPI002CABBF61|nr:YSC84-related protein [Dinghuibacter sp.]HTJ11297.1 YSC84-related protein [Dinghuibacter sp.]
MADFLHYHTRILIFVNLNFSSMKKKSTLVPAILLMILSGLFLPRVVMAQDASQARIIRDSKEAKASFLKADPSMKNLIKSSAGYVIFPNVGKGAAGLGGAAGKGAVYHKGMPVGTAQMTQVTVGAQAGGQAYREIIFFENKEALDRFMKNKIEFSGQASAIAAKAGASSDANYRNSVVVFSQEKTGLMLEASLGGQKFAYRELK